MRKLLIFITYVFFSQPIYAQLFDSLLHTRPQPTFALDGRTTKIHDRGVNIQGLKAGVEWGGKYRAGIGYYWVGSKFDEPATVNGQNINARFKTWYLGPYAEYAFYQSKRWELSVPAQIGFGHKRLVYSLNGEKHTTDNGVVVSGEAGIGGHYKLLTFIGLSGTLGYRQMLLPKLMNTEKLSGGFISFNIKIFPQNLYNVIFKGEDPYLNR